MPYLLRQKLKFNTILGILKYFDDSTGAVDKVQAWVAGHGFG